MLKFRDILKEMVQDQLDRLSEMGRILIDRFDIGPYKLFLLKNNFGWGADYDIALTSDENDFMSHQAQSHRKTDKEMSEIFHSYNEMKKKIEEWVDTYGEIRIGSMNDKKTRRYHRLLSNSKYKISDMDKKFGGTFFYVSPEIKDSEQESNSN